MHHINNSNSAFMSISVKKICKKYDKHIVLNNISFEVEKGEILGFLGPNGAGKSTIMKIITGFINPCSGIVELNGIDISGNSIDTRMLLGYLPENNPLYGDMYVREYLHYVAGLYKLKNKFASVDKMIDLTGLGLEQNKKIKHLSKGYKQRVGLSQALIHNPEIIILDEPTTGLDPNQLIEIRELIKHIGSDKTLMMSTHIMQEVEAICDRVLILNKGEIVADSNKISLLSKNQILEIELIENVDTDFFKIIPGVLNIEKLRANFYKLESEIDIRKQVFELIVSRNYTLIEMHKIEQNLEQMFNKYTLK